MSVCPYCSRTFFQNPSHTCKRCGVHLHKDCWEQIREREITGCGHQNYIPSVVYAHEDLILSSESGAMLHVWDLKSKIDQILKDFDLINRLLVTPDHKRVIAITSSTILLISLQDFSIESSYDNAGVTLAALNQKGTRLAITNGKNLFMIDLLENTMYEAGDPLEEYPQKITLSADGQRVAVLLSEGKAIIRDAELGMNLCQPDLSQHSTYFNNFLFIRDGAEIVLDNYSNLFFIDGMSGQLLRQEKLQLSPVGLYETSKNTLLLVTSSTQQTVQIKTFSRSKTPAFSEPENYEGLVSAIQGVSFLDENRLVAWSGEKILLVIDRSKKTAYPLQGHAGAFWVSPDIKSRRLWTLDRQTGLSAICLQENQVIVHAISAYPSTVEICALDSGEPTESIPVSIYPQQIKSFYYQDEFWLTILSGDGSFCLLRWSDRSIVWQSKIRPEEHTNPYLLTTKNPEDPLFVLVGAWNSFLAAYSFQTGKEVWSVEQEEISSSSTLLSTIDGELICLAKSKDFSQNGFIPKRISNNGELENLSSLQTDMSWSPDYTTVTPDGVHIVTGPVFLPDDGGAGFAIFDLKKGKLKGTSVTGHKPSLRALQTSPMGHLVATGAGDHCARIWDLRTGQPIAVFSDFSAFPIANLYFSPDAGTLLTENDMGQIDAWDLTGLDMRTDFFRILYQARQGKEESIAAAKAKLKSLKKPWPLEAIAGILLFRYLYPNDSSLLETFWKREDLTTKEISLLAQDFDRRVRIAFTKQFLPLPPRETP